MGNWLGFADLAIFWTEYENMIEYTFGAYPPDSATFPTIDDVGFKALNIGTARITGAEFSLNSAGRLGPVNFQITGGYTFMNPVDPVLLDSLGRDEDESYILKYRRRHLFKMDFEMEVWKLFAGVNVQYNSRMIKVDDRPLKFYVVAKEKLEQFCE